MKAADVQVVDDLLEQLADVLDERGLAVQVADRPELAEHLLAEAVRRRDRGGVEVGHGAGEAVAPDAEIVGEPDASRVTTGSASRRRARERPAQRLLDPTRRSRTRSRSSPVAIRVNVMSSSRSSGMPSAT